MNLINKNLSFNKQIALLLCCVIFFLGLNMILSLILVNITGQSHASIRISVVLQNLLVMIMPAVITAVIVTTNPLKLFCIDRIPNWRYWIVMVVIMVVSLPVMNWIVAWNQSIHLPEALSEVEMVLRSLEDQAADVTKILLSNDSVLGLVVTILTIGVMTGFSEELLFRGTLQRLIQHKPSDIHKAIWITAFVFSLMHFQFFGFVPRLLLGAYFGYLLWWSGSLWLPIVAHAINNSLVVVSSYIYGTESSSSDFETIGLQWEYALISAVLTVALIPVLLKWARKNDTGKQ